MSADGTKPIGDMVDHSPDMQPQEIEGVAVVDDRRRFLSALMSGFGLAVVAAACGEKGVDASDGGGADAKLNLGALCEKQPPVVKAGLKLREVTDCDGCHKKGGVGAGAWENLDPSDGALKTDEALQKLFHHASKTTSDGKGYMAEYAQQKVPNDAGKFHPGGVRTLTPDEWNIIDTLHQEAANIKIPGGPAPKLSVNTDCEKHNFKVSPQEYFSGVTLQTPDQVYMNFLRNVIGAPLPQSAPGIKNKEDLRNALRSASGHVGFSNWLVNAVNDFTHTKFYEGGDDAVKFLGDRYGVKWSDFSNKRLAQGPGNLLAYIVDQGRSVKEFLTAPYLVLPGAKHQDQPDNPDDDWRSRLQAVMIHGEPLSGLVTDALWLGQTPTSVTNIARHRAWEILRRFFDFDVLDIASRNVEAPKGDPLPTVKHPACVACHGANLDNFAAAFWDYQKDDRYTHNPKLPPQFLSLGLYGQKVPNDDPNRLGKMMQLMTSDPEGSGYPFARSMAKMAYTMLTGRDAVKEPKLDEMDYEPKMRRFQVQNDFFDEMAKFLHGTGYNFRELVIEMAMSPWCATTGEFTEPLSPNREIELKDTIGPRMITPEVLAIRLRQLFGNDVMTLGLHKLVMNEYRIDLGGIDSVNTKVRRREPNAASELVRIFLAFEVDKLVQNDLARPPQSRYLFNDLDWGAAPIEAPFNPGTNAQINEAKYRATLVKIHTFAFGKHFTPNSPEITAAYNTFTNMWMETLKDLGTSKIASTHVPKGSEGSDPLGLLRTWGAYMASIVQSTEFHMG